MIVNGTFLTEDEYYDNLRLEVLDDKKFSTITESLAGILGFAGLALAAGYGGALLSKSRSSKRGKIRDFIKRIFGKKKEYDFDIEKNRAVVRRELDKAKSAEGRLPEVFRAIKNEDWDEAEKLFKESNYTENPEMIKAVALAITDQLGEPPLFVYPQGNNTYFKCKKILGMKYAKAITQAVLATLRKNKAFQNKDILDTEIKVDYEY